MTWEPLSQAFSHPNRAPLKKGFRWNSIQNSVRNRARLELTDPARRNERAAGETLRPIFTKRAGQGAQVRTLKYQSVSPG